MDFNTRLRRIEKTIDSMNADINVVVFYDKESFKGYEPQPNDFIIIADYGEELQDDTSHQTH